MKNKELKNIEKFYFKKNHIHYVMISTTANINNPNLHVGIPYTILNYRLINIQVNSLENLNDIIYLFDGKINAFLIDVEKKNSVDSLFDYCKENIHHSSIIKFKPNDITISSFHYMINYLFKDVKNKNALIIGIGNLGFKISQLLIEIGFNVDLSSRNKEKIKHVTKALNYTKCGFGEINIFNKNSCNKKFDLIIGTSNGHPVITSNLLNFTSIKTIVIDVGIGTISNNFLQKKLKDKSQVYRLSTQAGLIAWIEGYNYSRQFFNKTTTKKINTNLSLISPGIIGSYGDIIVDDPNNWSEIIGVCDGKGGTLNHIERQKILNNFLKTN